MHADPLVFSIFLIFSGAALFAALALYAGQSLLIAYILLGCLVGPYALGLVEDPATIASVGNVGIIFLLFLLGMNLHPQKLLHMLREAVQVTVISSLAFALAGALIALAFGYNGTDALLIGAAMMFSSTIIALKLLPTTTLHHKHLGEIIISILLLQDMMAIIALLLVEALGRQQLLVSDAVGLALAPILLGAIAYTLEHYILLPVMRRFDTIQEYLFLAAIGWCLGIAQLGLVLGLSYEMGAFIAGVALARNPVSTFIAESLKPLRDFFLIMFFFSLGAGIALPQLPAVALPALALAGMVLVCKPLLFRWLLRREQETEPLSAEIGVRIGQLSEFSLLLVALAHTRGVISDAALDTVSAATIATFIVSSYWIVAHYPNPIAANPALRRD